MFKDKNSRNEKEDMNIPGAIGLSVEKLDCAVRFWARPMNGNIMLRSKLIIIHK
jgi:hypothetical protein